MNQARWAASIPQQRHSTDRSAAQWSKFKSRSGLLMCKADLRKRLNQMLRELWGPYLTLPAVSVG
jgi:hypothetical protein